MSVSTLVEPIGSFGNIATLVTDGYGTYTGLPQPPQTGYEYQVCTTNNYTGYSLQMGQAPAIVAQGAAGGLGSISTLIEPLGLYGSIANLITDGLSTAGSTTPGDIFATQVETTPNDYDIQIDGDGTVEIFSEGNTSRQSFLYGIYRVATNALSEPGTVWVNEVGPIWSQALTVTLPSNRASYTFNLNNICSSPEGDSLTFTLASGAFPPGFSIVSGVLTGSTGTGPSVYNFTFNATDSTGTSVPSSGCSITILSPSTPVWSSGFSLNFQVDSSFPTINLNNYCTASGDLLIFSLASGAFPPAVTLSGSNLSGTIGTIGVYTFTFIATDYTSNQSATSPLCQINITAENNLPTGLIPNLVGLSWYAASDQLTTLGLIQNTAPINVVSANVSPGTVIAQVPAANSPYVPNQTVRLTVAVQNILGFKTGLLSVTSDINIWP